MLLLAERRTGGVPDESALSSSIEKSSMRRFFACPYTPGAQITCQFHYFFGGFFFGGGRPMGHMDESVQDESCMTGMCVYVHRVGVLSTRALLLFRHFLLFHRTFFPLLSHVRTGLLLCTVTVGDVGMTKLPHSGCVQDGCVCRSHAILFRQNQWVVRRKQAIRCIPLTRQGLGCR